MTGWLRERETVAPPERPHQVGVGPTHIGQLGEIAKGDQPDLRSRTRDNCLDNLTRDWPALLPVYERLYAGRRRLPSQA